MDEAFGQVLRSLRQGTGLSQEAVGLASGNGRTFVSQFERGEAGRFLEDVVPLGGSAARRAFRDRPSDGGDTGRRTTTRLSREDRDLEPNKVGE